MSGSDSEMNSADGHSRSNLQMVAVPNTENEEASQGGSAPARADETDQGRNAEPQQSQLQVQFGDLIEQCLEVQDADTSIESDVSDCLELNARYGFQLFRDNFQGDSVAAPAGNRGRSDMSGGRKPGDFYMSCLHSKVIAEAILARTERIGREQGMEEE